MTQNNEREAFEKVFKLPIYLAWDDKFEGYIPKNKNDESSKLAAYAYDNRFQGWLARAKSQNEQKKEVCNIEKVKVTLEDFIAYNEWCASSKLTRPACPISDAQISKIWQRRNEIKNK